MSLSPGTQFGTYEIRAALGAGGMGEVYLARDNKLHRDVALKILPSDVTANADRIRRFETEARSASALNHPAIVSIYDLGQQDGQLFISMELVKGQTFRELFASGPLPARRALHLAAQVADGLAKAHDAGIVHRDLKPDNLMVTDDGFAKILDFGLAKLGPAQTFVTKQDDEGRTHPTLATRSIAALTRRRFGWSLGVLFRVVKSRTADREIDNFMTVPRSRPG